jgi:6-phosphogluconolactonase
VIERRVVGDPAALAAERIGEVAGAGGHIALAGGSTPRAAYEQAAALDIDWSGCTLWFGDERCVPPTDARSNYALVRSALLDGLPPGSEPEVHRIAGERGPAAAAQAYDEDLREELERFDLVLLGLGPDAHCASLFPHDPALDERDRRAVGVEKPGMEPLVPRVTLTLPVINAARQVLFLVTGEKKAGAVARAFAGPPDPGAPASLVAPEHGTLAVLLDAAAAAQLPAEARR